MWGEACMKGVQRACGPLAGVFRGQGPLNGGGENRTLVLSKLRNDHYMLSVLWVARLDAGHGH